MPSRNRPDVATADESTHKRRLPRDCHKITIVLTAQLRDAVSRSKATMCRKPAVDDYKKWVSGQEDEARMTEDEMRKHLTILKMEHRDLDIAIAALTDRDAGDQLQIARLKKRKLRLKDQISAFTDYLTPDIIA